jgi:ATP/maltotriose-dependent transcriptional regulator MalT/DNA-binding SARP family transcriptional activator
MGLAAKKAAPRTLKPLPLLTNEYIYGIPTFTVRYFEDLYSRLKPPFVIVLDNYQHIHTCSQMNDMISAGLDLVPGGINIIIISREDPPPQFARLRGSDKIRFLGMDEILFTLDESEKMLRHKGFLGFSDTMVLHLHELTRGWAAGLVLISERAKRKGFDDRTLTGFTPWEIFDYFSVEIFEKTDAETREFLLRTAFLSGMTVSMAEKLTGIARSKEILFRLHGDHFFTEKYTEPDPVYRYHPLFRDFLLSRAEKLFSRDEIALIQRNAAGFMMESGQMEEAAILLMDAGDWDGFIQFLLDYAPALMAQGRLKTLGEWLAAIPVNMVENSPWLLYWLGHCASVVTPAEGRAYLEQAFQLFNELGDDTGALQTWAGIADTFIYDFDDFKTLDRWIDWLDERISRDMSFPTPEIEAAVASSMVGVLVWRRPGHTALQQWINRALSSSQESRNSAVRLLACRRALLYYIWAGDRGASLTMLDEIGRIVELHSAPPAGLIAAQMIKAHYYAWLGDESERALQLVEEGLSMADQSGIHVVDSFLAIQGVYAALNKGDEGNVVRYARKLEATLQPGRRYVVFHHCDLSMLFLFVGKPSEAHAHAIKMLELSQESGLPFPEAWARTLLSQAAYEIGDVPYAEKELTACEKFYHQVGSPYFEFSTYLIKAYYIFGQRKDGPGLEILGKAMELGRQNGYTYSAMLFRPEVWSLLCAKALGAGIEIEYAREVIRRRRLAPPLPAAEYENWPWPVKIYTFGRFDLYNDDRKLEFTGKTPRRIISLLKVLLACDGNGVSEEKLIDILWPDSDGDAAHDSFSVSLHRLRQLMGNEKALHLRDGCLRLDPGICWVDAHAFEELLARAREGGPDEDQRLTEKALMLYRGPFLEETSEPWAISSRERLRSRYLKAVRRVGENLEGTGQFDRAVELYEKGLETDPLAEVLYRRLMECHEAAGQRGEAISVYERCKKILRSVLGVYPSPKTETIYRTLVR